MTLRSFLNTLLRIAALFAAVPVYWARDFFPADRFNIALTLFLFIGPYVILAVAPAKWIRFQIGWATGYSIGMLIAMFAAAVSGQLGGAFSYSTHSPYPVPSERLYLSANLLLIPLAVANWIYYRMQDHTMTMEMSEPALHGFLYPGVAVALQFFLNGIFHPA